MSFGVVTKVDQRLYLDSVVGVMHGIPLMGRPNGGMTRVGTNDRSGVGTAYHINGAGPRF